MVKKMKCHGPEGHGVIAPIASDGFTLPDGRHFAYRVSQASSFPLQRQ